MKLNYFIVSLFHMTILLVTGCGGGDNSNTAPTITGSPTLQVTEQQEYNFVALGADKDGDTLIYSARNLPSFLVLNSQTGELSGQPNIGDAGSYNDIIISVSDGTTSASLPSFNLEVLAFFYEVSIKGHVSAQKLNVAQVTLNYLYENQITMTDTAGQFEFALRVRASPEILTDLISIKAVGTGDFSYIELISIVGTLEEALQLAGDDKLLSSSESERVNVSSLSTAKYLLSTENNSGVPPSTLTALSMAESSMLPDILMDTAAVIQLIENDDNYSVDPSKTTLNQFFPQNSTVIDLLKTWRINQGIDGMNGERLDPNFDLAIQDANSLILENSALLPSLSIEQFVGLNVFGVSYPLGFFSDNDSVLAIETTGRAFLSYADRNEETDYGWLYQYEFSSNDLDGKSLPMEIIFEDVDAVLLSEKPFVFTINKGTGFDSQSLYRYNFAKQDKESIESALKVRDIEVSTHFQLSFTPIARVERGLLALEERLSYTNVLSEEFAAAGIERNDVVAEKRFQKKYVLIRTSESLRSPNVSELRLNNEKWVLPTYVNDSDLPAVYGVDFYDLASNGTGLGEFHKHEIKVDYEGNKLSVASNDWNIEATVFEKAGALDTYMVVLNDPNIMDSFSRVATIAKQNTLSDTLASVITTEWPIYLQDGKEYAANFNHRRAGPSGLLINTSDIRLFGISPDNRDCIDEKKSCLSFVTYPYSITNEFDLYYEHTNTIGDSKAWFNKSTIRVLGVSGDESQVLTINNEYTRGRNYWNRTSLNFYVLKELENAKALTENSRMQW